LDNIWNETFVAKFKALPRHLSGEAEENHTNELIFVVSGLIFEARTSHTKYDDSDVQCTMKGFVNICAYFIYLMTLSVAQNIQLRMKQ
jgi:hypothetical protein